MGLVYLLSYEAVSVTKEYKHAGTSTPNIELSMLLLALKQNVSFICLQKPVSKVMQRGRPALLLLKESLKLQSVFRRVHF